MMSRKDVEAREREWMKAFNAGDASSVAQLYQEDARLMAPNLAAVDGRPAIEGFVKEFVTATPTITLTTTRVHEAPEFCAAVGVYEMEIGGERDNGKYI